MVICRSSSCRGTQRSVLIQHIEFAAEVAGTAAVLAPLLRCVPARRCRECDGARCGRTLTLPQLALASAVSSAHVAAGTRSADTAPRARCLHEWDDPNCVQQQYARRSRRGPAAAPRGGAEVHLGNLPVGAYEKLTRRAHSASASAQGVCGDVQGGCKRAQARPRLARPRTSGRRASRRCAASLAVMESE